MLKKKKTPERKCIGCNQGRDKRELLRIVRTPEGRAEIDLTGKKSGRGCYICKNPDCLKSARRSRRIERALETEIPAELYEELERTVSGEEGV